MKDAARYWQSLPLWPEVDVFDKTVDGLVPSSRIESWRDFDKVVDFYIDNDSVESYAFRGQHHYKWSLEPTLDRFKVGAIDKQTADRHLQSFRLAIRGRVPDNSILEFTEGGENAEDVELWAVGQHHELATPLLDWTRSPFVALFFSFLGTDDPQWGQEGNALPEAHSRSVYIINSEFIDDLDYDAKWPRIIEPSKDDHGRLVNQAGLFTIAPYGETLESSLLRSLEDSGLDVNEPGEVAKYLRKVHIPNDPIARQRCLQWLRKMNIHNASLFPDLIGAAKHCNELTREWMTRSHGTEATKSVAPVKPAITVPKSASGVAAVVAAALLQAQGELQVFSAAEARTLAQEFEKFVDADAGVDWFIRESQLARLRTWLRRQLLRTEFPDELAKTAASAVVAAAAEEVRRAGQDD